jgi:Fe-S cluster assembly iron-binding protein IscA
MLELTRQAAIALTNMRHREGIPEHFGIRVDTASPTQDGEGSLVQVTWAEGPAEADEVSECGGVQVFVARELVTPLADKALDVDMGAVATDTRLTIREQDESSAS